MKKMLGVVLVVAVVSVSSFVIAGEASGPQTVAAFETIFESRSLSCSNKKEAFQLMEKSVLQKLFKELNMTPKGNVILTKTKYRNDLMNKAFAHEGVHVWGAEDMRVLYLLRAIWANTIDSVCFDQKATGFATEEWLLGVIHGKHIALKEK